MQSINFIIFVSATTADTLEVILKEIVSKEIFIIGINAIPNIIIIPTIPTEFFKIFPHPITVSTVSPIIFPTTGIKFATAALAVFAVIPSTELLNVPSIDNVAVKTVSTIPKHHTILDFKKLEILLISNFSEIFETIDNVIDINKIGIKKLFIKFPIQLTIKINIGCTKLVVTIFPVTNIRLIKIGISKFIKLTNSFIHSFVISNSNNNNK